MSTVIRHGLLWLNGVTPAVCEGFLIVISYKNKSFTCLSEPLKSYFNTFFISVF